MPTIRLNHRSVTALKVDQRTEFWDESLAGFGVRVTAKGRKSFIHMYRHNGRLRRQTLGQFPHLSVADARREYHKARGELAVGVDPEAPADLAREAGTVRELVERYIEEHAKRRKASWEEDDRQLQKDVVPAWGDRLAAEITRADVHALLERVVRRGAPVGANRLRALLSKMWNWAIDAGLLESSPCTRVRRPSAERSRDTVLTMHEVRKVWSALDLEHPVMAASLRLMLLTAQRMGELVQMKWEHVSGDTWVMPAACTKAGRGHVVHLSAEANEILATLEGLDPVWVFASHRVVGEPIGEKAAGRMLRRIRKRNGWRRIVPHDFRRTAASMMAESGVPRPVLMRILNHADSSVTAVYDRYGYLPEVRKALDAWGRRVAHEVGLGLHDRRAFEAA